MTNTVIVQASSRSNGDTALVVNYIAQTYGFDVIDLKSKDIGHFDYEYNNQDDDFFPIITEIISKYDTIIFATPVYWYSMSGILKVFFDRLSDLLTIHKDTGRKLRGKNMITISSSNADDLEEGYYMPFAASANYLGMNYLGDVHTWVEDRTIIPKVKARINTFFEGLLRSK